MLTDRQLAERIVSFSYINKNIYITQTFWSSPARGHCSTNALFSFSSRKYRFQPPWTVMKCSVNDPQFLGYKTLRIESASTCQQSVEIPKKRAWTCVWTDGAEGTNEQYEEITWISIIWGNQKRNNDEWKANIEEAVANRGADLVMRYSPAIWRVQKEQKYLKRRLHLPTMNGIWDKSKNI